MVKKTESFGHRFRFMIYLIVAAIIPYGLRLLHFSVYNAQAPLLYKNEWDLFVFCIAIAIAIMAENSSTSKSNSHIVHILFILLLPAWGLAASLHCESLKIEFDNNLLLHYNDNSFNFIEYSKKLLEIENRKETLFHISIILSIFFMIDCFYMVVLKKKNK